MKQESCKKYLEAHNNLVIKSIENKGRVTIFSISCSAFTWKKIKADKMFYISNGSGFDPYNYTVQCAN
jgi:hypothetical protein